MSILKPWPRLATLTRLRLSAIHSRSVDWSFVAISCHPVRSERVIPMLVGEKRKPCSASFLIDIKSITDSSGAFARSPETRVSIVLLGEIHLRPFSDRSDPHNQLASDWGSPFGDPLFRNPTVKWGWQLHLPLIDTSKVGNILTCGMHCCGDGHVKAQLFSAILQETLSRKRASDFIGASLPCSATVLSSG